MSNFISLKYFSYREIKRLVRLSLAVKHKPLRYHHHLRGKCVGLLFQKPSLRTKTSFYLGALQLGAEVIYYSPAEVKLGERETVADAAKTLSQYLDVAVLRTFSHQMIEEFAANSSMAVINALSDLLHPTQVLGDLLTLYELKKNIKKIKFSYIGDGNNVCHSLIYAFSILGGHLFVATPSGYEPNKDVLREASIFSRKSGGEINVLNSPQAAAKDADVLYTDVWTSMGQESETAQRKEIFSKFRIDSKILRLAKSDCAVMHCLPAHRGDEITDDVLAGRHSVIMRQAANRLYSAKAILLYALSKIK